MGTPEYVGDEEIVVVPRQQRIKMPRQGESGTLIGATLFYIDFYFCKGAMELAWRKSDRCSETLLARRTLSSRI